jgi:hypothetical protein
MQYAYRGHIVVLVDAWTASDGEAFAEGIKRLGLGKVLGTRTWGGEIWLTSSNVLVDRGIATAAEFGVYGPEGQWLIEGHGVAPDTVVDNQPHATFAGEDAQLAAAIAYLLVFGVGTILGMTAITGLLSLPFTLRAPRLERARRALTLATGALSLAFGLYLAFQIGVADGLLLGGSAVWRP